MNRFDSPLIELFFKKVKFKLQILDRATNTLVPSLVSLHYCSKILSWSERVYSLPLVFLKAEEDDLPKWPVRGLKLLALLLGKRV